MLVIKKLSKLIKKGICMAEDTARYALDYKEEDKTLADALNAITSEYMKCVDVLHEQVVRIIAAYRKEKGEPPKDMQTLYNYLHEEQIEMAREVKVLMEMYK